LLRLLATLMVRSERLLVDREGALERLGVGIAA
jgi:hypothetical protein